MAIINNLSKTYNNEYSIIDFDTNVESGYPESYNVEGRYTIPIPSFGELVFDGWYTSSDFNENNKIVEITPGMFNGGQITLYALWNPKGTNVYNIKFELLTESGDSIQEYIKNELGLIDTTQSCFSEDGVSFGLTNYITNLVALNNSTTSQYYYSLIYLVMPDGTTSQITDSSIVINNSNTKDAVLNLRVIQYEKIKINYEYDGREQEEYFYAVPNKAINIPNDTQIEYTLKSIASGNIETLWFTENTPTGSTYYRASNSKTSFDKDTTLYGFKYVPITLKLSQGTGSTLSVSKVENTLIFDTSFNEVDIVIETKSYYFAVGAKITFAASVTNSSEYESPKVTGSNPITVTENDTEFTVSSKADEKSCITKDTLITLANGTKKMVKDLLPTDLLLVFNHETGKYEFAPMIFNDVEPEGIYRIVNLKFSDGTIVKVVYEHGFFDTTLNKYVYIREDNMNEFIGHKFYQGNYDGTTYTSNEVTLVDAYVTEELTTVYSPVTVYHLNYFTEDMLSMPAGIPGLFNIFEYGDNLTPTAAFQQMNFNPTVFLNDITFLNDLMAEVSGIFPNMIGSIETTGAKTATEINTKTQGQMTRLSMLVDTINQDFIIPNVEKVAKLCADFKSGVETVFLNKENQPELIEIDDSVRQADYKYTYSDRSNATLKSEQADMLVQAVEKFAQKINLNLEEIFIWYFPTIMTNWGR